jgi:hypothetical protein
MFSFASERMLSEADAKLWRFALFGAGCIPLGPQEDAAMRAKETPELLALCAQRADAFKRLARVVQRLPRDAGVDLALGFNNLQALGNALWHKNVSFHTDAGVADAPQRHASRRWAAECTALLFAKDRGGEGHVIEKAWGYDTFVFRFINMAKRAPPAVLCAKNEHNWALRVVQFSEIAAPLTALALSALHTKLGRRIARHETVLRDHAVEQFLPPTDCILASEWLGDRMLSVFALAFAGLIFTDRKSLPRRSFACEAGAGEHVLFERIVRALCVLDIVDDAELRGLPRDLVRDDIERLFALAVGGAAERHSKKALALLQAIASTEPLPPNLIDAHEPLPRADTLELVQQRLRQTAAIAALHDSKPDCPHCIEQAARLKQASALPKPTTELAVVDGASSQVAEEAPGLGHDEDCDCGSGHHHHDHHHDHHGHHDHDHHDQCDCCSDHHHDDSDDHHDHHDGECDCCKAESNKPAVVRAPKIGRNEKCPCGSGRKFKKCCERA